jgi:hypothetical protein
MDSLSTKSETNESNGYSELEVPNPETYELLLTSLSNDLTFELL